MKTPSRPLWRPSPIRVRPSSLLLLAALLALPATVPAKAKKPPPVEAKRVELKDLQGRIAALQSELARAEETRAEATDQLRETESGISDINRSLRDLAATRSRIEAEATELERQGRQLEAGIAAQQGQLGRLLYRQYAAGEADALRLALSGADPNQVARDLHYLDLLAAARANLLKSLREALARKEALQRQAQAKREELLTIEQQRNQDRTALVKAQRSHQEILARLASRIKAQKTEMDGLKRNETRLGALIAGLARIVARPVARPRAAAQPQDQPGLSYAGDFAQQRGKLRLPVQGRLEQRFGSRRGDGGGSWKGLFIRAAEGTEVHALAAGRVVFADWLRGFGNLLIVDHGDDFLSVYGNNQALLRQLGDSVKGGETLATVGSSGGNLQSGLYFELRRQGLAIDPLKWVALK